MLSQSWKCRNHNKHSSESTLDNWFDVLVVKRAVLLLMERQNWWEKMHGQDLYHSLNIQITLFVSWGVCTCCHATICFHVRTWLHEHMNILYFFFCVCEHMQWFKSCYHCTDNIPKRKEIIVAEHEQHAHWLAQKHRPYGRSNSCSCPQLHWLTGGVTQPLLMKVELM